MVKPKGQKVGFEQMSIEKASLVRVIVVASCHPPFLFLVPPKQAMNPTEFYLTSIAGISVSSSRWSMVASAKQRT